MRLLLLFFLVIVFSSCVRKKRLDWDFLIDKYSAQKSDSLKLKAVFFLKENMDDITSQKVIFLDQSSKEKNISFKEFKNDSSLTDFLSANNIRYDVVVKKDENFLTTEFIENNIEQSFSVWNKYPWSKNVPFEYFLEYLLPYKVFDESPDNWKKALSEKYQQDISAFIKQYDTLKNKNLDEVYYRFVLSKMGDIFQYNSTPAYLSSRPGYDEMSCLKKGDCFGGSYAAVYYLRTLGVPATVDFVPYWGSKNGTHQSEVFLDTLGKMRTARERTLHGAAKVIRFSFKKQNIWRDSVSPFVDKENLAMIYNFTPKYLFI